MKYPVSFIVIILLFFCTNISKAENLLVYIDMNKIMNDTKAGISINQQLEKMHQSNINEFKNSEQDLKDEEKKLLAQKKILTKENYESKLLEFREKANIYRKNREKKINDLTKKRIEASNKILSHVNTILSDYSKKNGISIVLPKKNVVLAKTELDITNKIIDILNSKIKKINLN